MSELEDDVVGFLRTELIRYVTEHPFNNVAVLLSFLDHCQATESSHIADAVDSWSPDSLSMLAVYGGTNCVGAVKQVYNLIRQATEASGYNIRPLVTVDTASLPVGVHPTEVPYLHTALMIEDEKTEQNYLVDPGLGITEPIALNGPTVAVAERTYTIRETTNNHKALEVTKPSGQKLLFDFIFAENIDLEEALQKPLLRMTKEFKIDGFDALGNKKASVKIDVFKRRISYMVSSHTFSYSFEELSEMVNDESFFWLCRELGYDIVRLQEMIERVVYSEKLIVEMWYEALQREYYLRHSYKLSPLHTSWRELIEKGYKGGGVAVILLDQNERVLCYQIPEGITSKAAGRSAGQWNIFIETAEPIQPDQDGNTLEPFATNLQRAFSEEIGIPLPRATMQYFETDYAHKKIRARCAIFSVSAETIDEITKGSRTHAHEIGQTKWISLDSLDENWIEPSALRILQELRDRRRSQAK